MFVQCFFSLPFYLILCYFPFSFAFLFFYSYTSPCDYSRVGFVAMSFIKRFLIFCFSPHFIFILCSICMKNLEKRWKKNLLCIFHLMKITLRMDLTGFQFEYFRLSMQKNLTVCRYILLSFYLYMNYFPLDVDWLIILSFSISNNFDHFDNIHSFIGKLFKRRLPEKWMETKFKMKQKKLRQKFDKHTGIHIHIQTYLNAQVNHFITLFPL